MHLKTHTLRLRCNWKRPQSRTSTLGDSIPMRGRCGVMLKFRLSKRVDLSARGLRYAMSATWQPAGGDKVRHTGNLAVHLCKGNYRPKSIKAPLHNGVFRTLTGLSMVKVLVHDSMGLVSARLCLNSSRRQEIRRATRAYRDQYTWQSALLRGSACSIGCTISVG